MNKDQILNLLRHHYFQLKSPIAFANEETIYEYFKDYLSRKDIKKFLSSLPEYTKTRRYVQKFHRNYIFAPTKRYLLQTDLKDLKELSKSNKNYRYILILIDCKTRYLWARLLRTKNKEEVTHAFRELIQETGPFLHLCSDSGKEYVNSEFKGLMREHNINFYVSKSTGKAHIAERVIRTLSNLIYKFNLRNKTKTFVPYFQDIIKTYNNKKHRIIGLSPTQAESGQFDNLLEANLKKYRDSIKKQYPVFSVGDKVRIALKKKIFDKGYTQSSLPDIFRVSKVNKRHKIPLYSVIRDSDSQPVKEQFYAAELQSVKQ